MTDPGPAGLTAPRTRTSKSADERRREILDAGKNVVVERGLAGLTISEVARGAAIAQGTVYLHFASKDDLAAGLCEDFVSEMLLHVEGRLARQVPSDWRTAVDTQIDAFVTFCLDNREWHNALFGRSEVIGPLSGSEIRLVGSITDNLRVGMDAQVFDVDDPEATALILYRILDGVVDHILNAPDDSQRTRYIEAARTAVLRVIGGRLIGNP